MASNSKKKAADTQDDAAEAAEAESRAETAPEVPLAATSDDAEESKAEAAEADSPPRDPAGDGGETGEAEPTGEGPTDDGPDSSAARSTDGEALPPRSMKQRARGWGIFGVGIAAVFMMMANASQLPHGTVWGTLSLLVALFGLFDALDLLRVRPGEAVRPWNDTTVAAQPGENRFFAPVYTVPLALLIVVGAAVFGTQAIMPGAIVAAMVILGLSGWRRPGFALFALVGLVYLPLLGSFALWDPWETHYGEVAREIISRDDWISLWWAQEEWFWSKPILIFWSEAWWLSALGVDCAPGANPAHPEWAIRLPVVLFAITAIVGVYATISRLISRRAGLLAALVLATMPHFFFLAHQAITDMYLVANLTLATSMLALAFALDPEKRDQRILIPRLGIAFGMQHLVLGFAFMLIAPQGLYLLTRNVELLPEGFHWHRDVFLFGSAGNEGVAGNEPLRDQIPHATSLVFQPFAQGLLWLLGLGAIVWRLSKERRLQGHAMTAFYLFVALAFMGKSLPGVALPGLVALLYLTASKRWQVLLSGQLRVGWGILVTIVTGMPWYVAMYIRHGPPFTERLLVHDNINRLAAGVHGDKGSIAYFLQQLGYATFPWVALVPAAGLAWVAVRSRRTHSLSTGPYRTPLGFASETDHRRQTLMLFGMWFFAAFALFSAMITKFHHYIFPAVPPAAILVGVLLDRLWGERGDGGEDAANRDKRATLLAALSPLALVSGFGLLWGDLRGVIPEGVTGVDAQDWVLHHGQAGLGWGLVALGVALLGGAAHQAGLLTREGPPGAKDLALATALALGAVLVGLVGRDLSWNTSARPQGYERLIHLFVYNYGREWPAQFDYRPVLTGFAIVATSLFGLAAVRRARPIAVRALVGLSLVFSAWVLNVYMVDLSDHWGQRLLVKRYYELRESDEDLLVAWQMNWKGENFYSGNHVEAFVDLDTAPFREWVGAHEGTTIFVITEHARLGGLRSALGGRRELEEVTTKRECNKFVVVRVEL